MSEPHQSQTDQPQARALGVTSLEVSVSKQTLSAVQSDDSTIIYSIATASNGVGQQFGSECTPLGEHRIRAKIGGGCPLNTVFIGRRASGELYSEDLARRQPSRDWILTRILWLCGNQPGFNRLGDCDTMRRYIYIHGAPDAHAMGVPSSHGCIKMRNTDVVDLYERVAAGTPVFINA